MAQLALPMMIASTAISAVGTIAQGNAARAAGNYQAAQLNQQAGQERAIAQRNAIEQRHKATLANSRALAVAAAGGGGASDPTVNNIMGDITGQGEYNALSALYTGEERARGMNMQADVARLEGKQARSASLLKAGTTILGAGSTLADRFGGF